MTLLLPGSIVKQNMVKYLVELTFLKLPTDSERSSRRHPAGLI